MPWPYLPDDFAATHDTAWVVCENSLYDPQRGHEVYNRYLDELEFGVSWDTDADPDESLRQEHAVGAAFRLCAVFRPRQNP